MDDKIFIKQINVGTSIYDIDALKWAGHEFSDIESMIHGVVDTYVIPAQRGASSESDYVKVVEATTAQVSTTKSALNALTSSSKDYKVGDIILMGATSDDKNNFDRWISNISGSGDDAVITLDVLETQVATHHHTLNVSTSRAIVNVEKSLTSYNVAKVGNPVNVLTSVGGTFLTSVDHDDNGDLGLTFVSTKPSNSTKAIASHSHTVNSHHHTINPSTIVSRTIEVYCSLSSGEYTPHTHTTSDVAGPATAVASFKYINGGTNTTKFVKSLTNSSSTSTTGSTSTSTDSVDLITTIPSTIDINSDVSTMEGGSHTHDVSVTTGGNVITSVNIAPKVVTSVSYTKPTIQTSVVTSISYSSVTKVLTSFSISPSYNDFVYGLTVDASGVLSCSLSEALTGVNVTSVTSKNATIINSVSRLSQKNGSFAVTSTIQEFSNSSVELSGTANTNGSHSHGFGHTHAIAGHSHTVNSHTHTYYRTVVSETGTAYTSLTSKIYYPHDHTSVTVAAQAIASNAFTYFNNCSKVSVVRDLKNSVVSTTSSNPGTDSIYLVGDITFPGFSTSYASVTTSTTEVVNAADGGDKAIKSITITSASFVTGIDNKTSTNKGGE